MFDPLEVFEGTDQEYNELFDCLKDMLNEYGDLELYYDYLDEVYTGDDRVEHVTVKDYTWDNYDIDRLLYDAAEFLDISINELTADDLNKLDRNKFLDFLTDEYYDTVIDYVERHEDNIIADAIENTLDTAYWDEVDRQIDDYLDNF